MTAKNSSSKEHQSQDDLRFVGVQEQYERSRLFFGEALKSIDCRDSFRRLMAAVYFGRAALELMRETAKDGGLKIEAEEFDNFLSGSIHRFNLIRKIRIHDFHKYAVLGSGVTILDHKIRIPPHGSAEVSLNVDTTNPNLKVTVSDGSNDYWFFMTSGELVQDENEARAVPMREVLGEYLDQLPAAMEEFQSLLRNGDE